MRRHDPFGKMIYDTEAALCAAFIAWVSKTAPGVKCFAEWWGWDILVAYPNGHQIGIQAKLRLNAEVVGQAAPSEWDLDSDTVPGPDYRAVLVPNANGLSAIAQRLGLVVFHSTYDDRFTPDLRPWVGWLDWNPHRRVELPPCATDSIAGSSAPITLTHWKLAALDVLAEIEIKGTITTKRMKALGINPSRWLSCRWLVPAHKRGLWARGDKCHRFDLQHPTAYALALDKARSAEISA